MTAPAAPEPELHALSAPELAADVITVSCSCKGWAQSWYNGPLSPGWMDVESSHRAHVLASTRARLTPEPARVRPPQFPAGTNPGLDALISAARAMAEQAETAADALQEFVDAHKAAGQNGVGVLITRGPGGTIHSTPNVYLAPGVVLYAEDPGAPWVPAPAPFTDASAPFEPGTGWLPRYTRPTHDAPPLHDVA